MVTEELEIPLAQLRAGQSGMVKAVSAENRTLYSKLLTMGIVVGTLIEVLAIAPLGDPLQIRARGYKLSLRVNEAEVVRVTPL
jgi:ferrous iron transport protein A